MIMVSPWVVCVGMGRAGPSPPTFEERFGSGFLDGKGALLSIPS
jgi:hypothetical protein